MSKNTRVGVGSYAVGGEPRENYAARYHEQWTSHHEKRLATGLPVVPCVAMDRNPQPRIDAPVVRGTATPRSI